MINSKINTDIMTTTGFEINIPPSKVVINNQEITDLETFNKVVDSIKEKDKEIERLNNIIDEFIDDIEDYLDSNPKVFCGDCDIYYRDLEIQDKHCEGFDFTIKMQEKINKLKELKGSDKDD